MQKFGRTAVIGAIAAVAAFGLTACGDDSSAAPSRECTVDDVKTTGNFGQVPTITIPDDCAPPKKLLTKDLSTGTGKAAAAGSKLSMNYLVVTWSNKKKLDSSFDRGEPFGLDLGAGQVIDGWDQGLVGVKQGGRRLMIIPPALAYKDGGRGIAPNETLVFVTDALSVG
ncbi:FKBP-type peptidyl-prolyl cis-trans isomerase [Amycolatopsis sp. GA6-003]|uniref:FKBP-type peptidyl-prolyl cis-trans isomerase n=1 Tax=Amycolatopsis sp. GA6-003 TaxID=2652444 RepID=UPI003916DCE6